MKGFDAEDLRRVNTQLVHLAPVTTVVLLGAYDEISRLHGEVSRLQEALDRYGGHDHECETNNPIGACMCGFGLASGEKP